MLSGSDDVALKSSGEMLTRCGVTRFYGDYSCVKPMKQEAARDGGRICLIGLIHAAWRLQIPPT